MKSQWGAGVPDDWSPATVIPKPHYESYARARVAGAGPSAAYRAHVARTTDVKSTSVKSAAHHLERHPAISARIEWLRRAKTEELEADSRPLTGPVLRQLMEACTTALMGAHDAAEASAVADMSTLAKLRKAATTHLGRLSRATEPVAAPVNAGKSACFGHLLWCQC